MSRGFRVFAILLVLILVSGVKGCEKGGKISTGAYVGGTDGLAVSFVADEPPAKVLDNNQDPFSITLSIENNGEYDIPKGGVIASISGIPKTDFSMASLDAKSTNVIEGKHRVGEEVVEGVTDELRFVEARYKYDLNANLLQNMRVDVCYLYQTEGLAKLCLKKNPAVRDEEDICRVNNEAADLESSSAPVKITNLRERSAGESEVLIMFDVENVGAGSVYPPNAFTEKCSGQDKNKDRLSISVKSVAGNIQVKCATLGEKSSGEIRLVNNKKTVSCKASTSNLQETAFESPFSIELKYFYKVSLYKEILIENL